MTIVLVRRNLDIHKATRDMHARGEIMWEHSKNAAVYEPWKEASQETNLQTTPDNIGLVTAYEGGPYSDWNLYKVKEREV